MNTRFLMFFSVILAVLSLGSLYVGRRVIAHSEWAAVHPGAIWILAACFVLLELAGPILYQRFRFSGQRPFILQWASYSALGLFACTFFYLLMSDGVLGFLKLMSKVPVDGERRAFFGVGLLSVSSAAAGVFQALSGPRIYRVSIPIENLPAELEGFTLAQVSDLHIGPILDRRYASAVVEHVNALAPDVIALTGDFIDGEVKDLASQVAPLRELRARHGVFFVTGNHEYYWDAPGWIEEFRKMGARPLLNESATIRLGSASLAIAGIPDRNAGGFFPEHKADLKRALEGVPTDAIKVLLAHQPDSFKEAQGHGFHLQLSGHTHGGQFFPWSLMVAAAQKYYKGLYRHTDGMFVYVNRGTGFWGPPIRFTVPSEVTLLTLKRA